MSDHIKSLTWLTDLHLEFCGHRTRDQLYHSINQRWAGARARRPRSKTGESIGALRANGV